MSAPIPVVIPLSDCGGKLKNNRELCYALRSLERHFTEPFEVVIVGKRLPAGFQGLKLLACEKGLKSAIRVAAEAFPAGFFWYYDDCVLLQDTTAERMKVTPACRVWRSAKTSWAQHLEKIRKRLEKEGWMVRDYSRPHGPYWFDKGMVDEGFADWPAMVGKFPWETWILSKRKWPACFGSVKQYYGRFNGAPGEGSRYLNYNDRGFTPELRAWLDQRFPEPCRFEEPPIVREMPENPTVRGVVIRLPQRPRWEAACVSECAKIGIHLDLFDGNNGYTEKPTVIVRPRAFRARYKRGPLPGEIGCFCSHVEVARKFDALPALAPGFEDWRLVLEDDALPHGIDAARILAHASFAVTKGFNLVNLHAGRSNYRAGFAEGLVAGGKTEIGCYAYLVHSRAAKEIAGWTMSRPIDLAVRNSKRLHVGVLNGNVRFSHRAADPAVPALFFERRGIAIQPLLPTPQPRSKFIHQVWVQGESELPEHFRENRRRWQEAFSDYEMMLWDDASAAARWPDYAAASSRCFHHATRADLILARAIRDFGGIATGTDCTPNAPEDLRALIEAVSAFVVLTPGRVELSNGLQWSAFPGHPFWDCVCKHQLRQGGKHLGSRRVSAATGPICYHEAFHARPWQLHVVTAPAAFTRDWAHKWENPRALIDPGFAASWTKKPTTFS